MDSLELAVNSPERLVNSPERSVISPERGATRWPAGLLWLTLVLSVTAPSAWGAANDEVIRVQLILSRCPLLWILVLKCSLVSLAVCRLPQF